MARSLQAKGFEVLVPLIKRRVQWSDRIKTCTLPLFGSYLFCRLGQPDWASVLKTPNVSSISTEPVQDRDFERLRRVLGSPYELEPSDLPATGDVVRFQSDPELRGVLVERSEVCRVAIGLDSIGRAVTLRIPLSELARSESGLSAHWTLRSL